MATKYIFVTGGVVSGLGKGIKSFKEGVKSDDESKKKITSGSEQKPEDQ